MSINRIKYWIKPTLAALVLTASFAQTVQAATEVKVGMSGRYFPFTFVEKTYFRVLKWIYGMKSASVTTTK
jgi:hypothetical protein